MTRLSPMTRLAQGGETIAVTGASGWFGRVTLDLLGRELGPSAFRERVTAFASRRREVEVEGVGPVLLRPLEDLEPAEVLLHYAFITRRRIAPEAFDSFVAANVGITARVLETLRRGGVRRLLVASSGAVRDPDLRRNPYGALKALDELALPEAARRAGASCVIARIFNVAGPHMSQPGDYALGDLIVRAKAGRPLELSARGHVVRAYTSVEAVVLVGLGELLEDRDACFETGGTPVEIGQLAEAVRRVVGRPDLPIRRHRDPAAPPSVYLGDGTVMRELAERHGVALPGLDPLITATAATLPPTDR